MRGAGRADAGREYMIEYTLNYMDDRGTVKSEAPVAAAIAAADAAIGWNSACVGRLSCAACCAAPARTLRPPHRQRQH